MLHCKHELWKYLKPVTSNFSDKCAIFSTVTMLFSIVSMLFCVLDWRSTIPPMSPPFRLWNTNMRYCNCNINQLIITFKLLSIFEFNFEKTLQVDSSFKIEQLSNTVVPFSFFKECVCLFLISCRWLWRRKCWPNLKETEQLDRSVVTLCFFVSYSSVKLFWPFWISSCALPTVYKTLL